MRFRVLLLAVGCLLSAVSAQWLEKALYLPDSLRGLSIPQTMLFDPDRNCTYVGGKNAVVVFDASTGRSRARIAVPGQISTLCLNPERGKLYAAVSYGAAVYSIDCSAMQVRRAISTGFLEKASLAYSRATDRVFAIGDYGRSVLAISCTTDTVDTQISGFRQLNDICANAEGTKLYCADESREGVWVLDCATGARLDSIWTGAGPFTLLYNHLNDKVYCSDNYDEDVAVIDAVRDSLIRFVAMNGRTYNLALNPLLNRVYCATGANEIGVICGTGDTLAGLAYCERAPAVMAFDSSADVLCAAPESRSTVMLIDGTDNSLLTVLRAGPGPRSVCYDARAGKVLVGNGGNATLALLDCRTLSITDTVLLGMSPGPIAWSGNVNRVYCADQQLPKLAVIDGEGNYVRRLISLERQSGLLLPVPEESRVYCFASGPGDTGLISIISQPADSVTRVVPYRGRAREAVYTPNRQLYYLSVTSTSYGLQRFDCRGESLIGHPLLLPGEGQMTCAVRENRLFVACGASVFVVDVETGQIIRAVPTSGPAGNVYYVPQHNAVAVTLPDSSALGFIDVVSCSLLGTLQVGHAPWNLCYNSRHDLLYCAVEGPQLVLVDMASRLTVGTLPTAEWQPTMVLDTIADRLYLQTEGLLEVVDCAAGHRVRARFSTGYTDNIAWNPLNRRVYVRLEGHSALAVFRDSTVAGVAEGDQPQATGPKPPATVVRGVLEVRDPPAFSSGENRGCTGISHALLDISGRKVLDLKPGHNDVSRLAPGVYFVWFKPSAVSCEPLTVTKVVVQR